MAHPASTPPAARPTWKRQGALQRNNDRPAARMDTEPYDAVSQTLLDAAHLAVVWSKLHVVLALLRRVGLRRLIRRCSSPGPPLQEGLPLGCVSQCKAPGDPTTARPETPGGAGPGREPHWNERWII